MANTFDLISSYTVSGSSTNQVTFNPIPQTYSDLSIYISSRTNVGSSYSLNNLIQINNQSTESSYSGGFAYFRPGDSNSTLYSQTSSPISIWASGTNDNDSNVFSFNWIYIPNYASGDVVNIIYAGGNQPSGIQVFGNSRPSTGEAITSLTFKQIAGLNFIAGSTFYLYGIKNT